MATRTKGISRFTVSVPAGLLAALDQRLTREGESRSAVIRRLIEAALRDADEQANVERYVRGYQAAPQTEEEVGLAESTVDEWLAELPWR